MMAKAKAKAIGQKYNEHFFTFTFGTPSPELSLISRMSWGLSWGVAQEERQIRQRLHSQSRHL